MRLTHGAMSNKCRSNSDMLKRSTNKKLALCLTRYQSPPEHDVALSTGYQSKMKFNDAKCEGLLCK